MMEFRILTGEDFDETYLSKVLEIDEMVYAEAGYVGELKNIIARYQAEPRQFVCLEEVDTNRLAGYINFLPCSVNLYEDIRYQSQHIRDDDITPEELVPLHKGDQHIYLASIALHPDYKDTGAIKELTNHWIDYLNQLLEQGYAIKSLTATAVSPDGRRALHRMQFEEERILKEDGNILYVCEGDHLHKLLNKELRLHD